MIEMFWLDLPWPAPPLQMNHRRHWRAHALIAAQIRHAGWALAREAKIGSHDRVRVTLHWQPRDRRVRDTENPVPTLKALCDGLVDAKVVEDDDRDRMVKDMPVIHDPVRGEPGRLWLEVRPLASAEVVS